jgi:hypothetical protein
MKELAVVVSQDMSQGREIQIRLKAKIKSAVL